MTTWQSTFAATAALFAAAPALAEPPLVLASIKPVHSLVASVMEGVGEPALLLDGAGDPHTYAIRPSDAASLAGADLVFWVGPGIESFMVATIPTLASGARSVELGEAPGLTLLPIREGGLFEPHAREAEDPAHEEEHGHEESQAGDDDPAHADHGMDAHVWLDPANAAAMVDAIADALSDADPENAAAYAANAAATRQRLARLTEEIRTLAEPAQGGEFVTFHDAFQYFEAAFGARAIASVAISPEVTPGARRIAELQALIGDTGALCLVTQPQFPGEIVSLLATEATRSAVLDDIGADIPPGPGLYETLLRQNAEALAGCIGQAS